MNPTGVFLYLRVYRARVLPKFHRVGRSPNPVSWGHYPPCELPVGLPEMTKHVALHKEGQKYHQLTVLAETSLSESNPARRIDVRPSVSDPE